MKKRGVYQLSIFKDMECEYGQLQVRQKKALEKRKRNGGVL